MKARAGSSYRAAMRNPWAHIAASMLAVLTWLDQAHALGTAPGDIAAFVIALRGEVDALQMQRSPSGRLLGRAWTTMQKGDPLSLQDVIRTSTDGRVVVEFADRIEAAGVGPSTFSIGPGTRVAIADFDIDLQAAAEQRKPKTVLELIRGKIRNFIKGWGQRSDYSVRAGVAVCSLRGAEGTIDYDPDRARLTVTVHEGKVVVAGPRGSRIVRAGETVVLEDIQATYQDPEAPPPA